MANKKLTELVFILDRSGSMSGLETDTIGGYNGLLDKQREQDGDAVVTTVLFDHDFEVIHDRADLRRVKDLTEREYYARGSTALLDAIGATISRVGNRQKNALKGERPQKTVVVIMTDGYENSSREYSLAMVRQMIRRQRSRYGWEFLFLGANIDAVDTAEAYGIGRERSVRYEADSVGTEINFRTVCNAVSRMREDQPLEADWKEEIEQYYHKKN